MDKIGIDKTKIIIKKYMKENNLNNEKIGILLNINKNTVSSYLQKNKRMPKVFLKKISELPNLVLKDKKSIQNTLKEIEKIEKKPKKDTELEEIITQISRVIKKDFDEIKIFIQENHELSIKPLEKVTRKEENNYFQNRKIGSFNSDLENRTLLIKKMWNFNDTVLEEWKEFSLLLGINNKKDNIKMKKGLLTIATNLKEIAEKLENAAFDKDDIGEKEEIIIIK